MKKWIGITLVVLMLVVFLSACGQDGPPGVESQAQGEQGQATNQQAPDTGSQAGGNELADDHRYGGTLRVVETTVAGGPLGTVWNIAIGDTWLVAPIKQNLVREFPDASVEPLLARDWSIDEENSILTFYLQEGVVFHDGSPFNAEVVKWNFDMTSENMALGFPFETEVIDTYTVAIYLPNGFTNASVGWFGHVNFRLMSMEAYLTHGYDWVMENPIGTGPFRLVEYSPGSHAAYERFEDYWESGKPFLDRVEFHMITDVMTLDMALRVDHGEGAIDGVRTQNAQQVAMFREMGYQTPHITAMVKSLFPSSDNPDSPWSNHYVRLALSAAIDRDAIVAARGFGVWYPMYQFIVSARPSHVTDPGYGVPRFDPDYARELLARGGFPDGFNTTIIAQPGAADREAIVAIQSMLADVGIVAELEFPEAAGFVATRVGGWEGILTHTVTNFVHIENNFTALFGQEANQFFSMRNSDELEELGWAAHVFGDNRAEIRAAQSYMLDEGLVIPLWAQPATAIMRPGVLGWCDRTNWFWFPDMWLDW